MFERWHSAAEMIAGASVAGRIVHEAQSAGARQIWIVAAEARLPPAELLADVDRLRGDAEVRVMTAQAFASDVARSRPRDMILLGGNHLIRAAALRRFIESRSATLCLGTTIVAVRKKIGRPFSFGDHALFGVNSDAVSPEILPLVPRGAAARRIILLTAKDSDGLVSRWINRPISRRISGLLLMIPGLRPAHVTIVTAIVALLMFLFLLNGTQSGLVTGAILFQVASIVDGVDGEMARASFRTSLKGAIFDTTVDMATNLLFCLGVTISLTRLRGPIEGLLGGCGFLAALSGLLIVTVLVRHINQPGSFDIIKTFYRDRYPDGTARRIVDALVVATSRDFFAFAFAALVVLGAGAAIPWILSGAATLWLLSVVIAAQSILATHKRVGVSQAVT